MQNFCIFITFEKKHCQFSAALKYLQVIYIENIHNLSVLWVTMSLQACVVFQNVQDYVYPLEKLYLGT